MELIANSLLNNEILLFFFFILESETKFSWDRLNRLVYNSEKLVTKENYKKKTVVKKFVLEKKLLRISEEFRIFEFCYTRKNGESLSIR